MSAAATPVLAVDEQKPLWGNLVGGTIALTADGFDLVIMSYLLPYVQKEFHVSLGVASLLLLATTGMRWVGALLFGALANRFGRKPVLIASVSWLGLFTLASGLAPTFWILLLFRLLFGLGVGGGYASAGSLVRESAGRRGGLFSGIMIFGWFVGVAVSPYFYYWFLPLWGWRGVFFTEAAILLLVPYLIFGLKESEIWKAQHSAALCQPKANRTRNATQTRAFMQLFAPTYIATTIMLVVLEYGDFFAQSSTNLLPTFLHSTHLSVGQIAIVGSISGFAGMPGSLIGGWLCDKLGRRRTFRLLFAIIWIPVVVTFSVRSFAAIVIAWTVFALINGSLGGALAVFETEQYPTHLRAAGYGFAHNFGALGGSFGATIAAFLSATLSLPIAIIIMTVFGVVLGLISLFFAQETIGQSLLEDRAAQAREQRLDGKSQQQPVATVEGGADVHRPHMPDRS